MDNALEMRTTGYRPGRQSKDMVIALPDSIHLVHEPARQQWTLISSAGPVRLNATAAGILQLASQPITLPALIDTALGLHRGALIAMDVLAFVEAALAQEWLEYRP